MYVYIYIHRLQVAHTESFPLFNLSAIHLILSKYCLLTACLRFVEIQKSLGPGFAWLKMPWKKVNQPTNSLLPYIVGGFHRDETHGWKSGFKKSQQKANPS